MSPPVPDRTLTLEPRATSVAPSTPPPPENPVSDDPERYEQIAEHARGGLGRVVRALDKRLGRTVAVKELLRRSESNEARFLREALITARLEHPGIVPVHEAGRWPNGDPYYVMKLVEGRTLKELLAERKTTRERLELLQHVIAVADAVGYAHSEGVIHRDLKPSNIMVGAFGETIVVDWGLACDRRRDLPEPAPGEYVPSSGSGPVSTVSGKVVGTPGYMAPEQARGEPVDERADVYALGAVLYELLAGSPPHADTTPRATIERVLAGPPPPLATVTPHVPSELATIVAKAMARDPEERYPNATALAEDLRRYQTGKLVSAHSYSVWSLLRKKLAQHRAPVAVAVASAIALGLVGVESFRRVVHQRNIAQHERMRSEDALAQAEKRKRELVLLQARTSLRRDPTAALAWLKSYPIADDERAELVDVIDEAIANGVARHVFRPGAWVLDAVFSRDGTTVVATVLDGTIRVYDLRTGTSTVLGSMPHTAEVLELSPDGETVLAGGPLGEVVAWPLRGGAPRTLLEGSNDAVFSLRFSRDGRRVLVYRDKQNVEAHVVSLDGDRPFRIGPRSALRTAVAADDWSRQVVQTSLDVLAARIDGEWQPIARLSKVIQFHGISPRGDRVLVHDGETVWKVRYGGGLLEKLATYRDRIHGFEWSPDRRKVAIVGDAHDIVIVDVETGETRELRGHTDALYTVQWSRDGKRLVSASDDATARVWSLEDGSTRVLRGHEDDVYRARVSTDERQVATASLDGSLRIWELTEPAERTLVEGRPVSERFELVGDRAIVKTAGTVALWDLATGTREERFAWTDDSEHLNVADISRDGELLLVPRADWSLEVRRRDAPTVRLVGHTAMITRQELTRDNRHLYTSAEDGTLRRWDTITGKGEVLVQSRSPVRLLALRDDGHVAVRVGDEVRILRPDGTSTVVDVGEPRCVLAARFDAHVDRLLALRCDRTAVLVAGSSRVELVHSRGLHRLALSSDSARIAGAMNDRTVRIWDARTGEQLAVLSGHSDLVYGVAFSPDGAMLATSSHDRTVRIWELATMHHRVLRGHAGAVEHVAWRDNQQLVTAARDGTLRLWKVPSMSIPSAAELGTMLTGATSALIEHDRPTTLDGPRSSS
jgi:WD40 repeat protein